MNNTNNSYCEIKTNWKYMMVAIIGFMFVLSLAILTQERIHNVLIVLPIICSVTYFIIGKKEIQKASKLNESKN